MGNNKDRNRRAAISWKFGRGFPWPASDNRDGDKENAVLDKNDCYRNNDLSVNADTGSLIYNPYCKKPRDYSGQH